MPFAEVPAKIDFVVQEHNLLDFWKQTDAFDRLRELHAADPHWSFIDGPITANNPMGVHHGWGRTYKDVFQRFWTMRGRHLRYQNGFDCQGLWVEVEVERQMGFRSKKDIEDYGLERFVRQCKARVLRYAAVQTEQSIRLGYWMDWNDPDRLRWLAERLIEDPLQVITIPGTEGPVTGTVEQVVGQLGMRELGGSYFTFADENNYMIWTFLKKCWEKGWLYHGVDVMPWCPRCATGISQHEIVTDGYAELTHPSVSLRFPLRRSEADGRRASLLVWTTTPWTLSSNVAVAAGPDLTYARVRQGEELLYLSNSALHMLKGAYEKTGELLGTQMAGWTYDGPYDDLPVASMPGGQPGLPGHAATAPASAAQSHQVILWDAVGEAEGTGLVHIAPGCGAEDFELGKAYRMPMLAPLTDEGYFVDGFGWLTGRHVYEVNEAIFADLERKGLLYRVEPYTHRYPICWRCRSQLIFRLVDEWFISMGEVYDKPREAVNAEEQARSLRYQIMDVVDRIKWIPEFGHAREMEWLHNMHDWMISKKRYWGLALPIWVCAECGAFEVIGDEQELQTRAVAGWEQFAGHTPHRPYVDAVRLACAQCGGTMSRIADVGNPWLDAGIVPFSTLRYRHDRAYWQEWYPANWISESFPGQFRNWFYSLLAMATVVDSSPPFLENFSYATLLAEDGRPMHKSWGNMIEFNESADRMGVDVMRWLYCQRKPESDLLFGYTRGDEVRRSFIIPLWNVYSFFVTYANLDGWLPGSREADVIAFDPACPEGATPTSANLLDRWIVACLNNLCVRFTEALEASDPAGATAAAEAFLDDLANWYVRRSRRRFWKSEQDADKGKAYATLYHVLVKLCRLLAPVIPFVTEAMYQNLVANARAGARASVHHTAWPQADAATIDAALLESMEQVRQVASLGLSARNAAGLKVRQPLLSALAYVPGKAHLDDELATIITDELNVKTFEIVDKAGQLVNYVILPNNKLLGPRLGAQFPRLRAALAAADAASIVQSVQAGLPVSVDVDGQTLELSPEEVLVQARPVAGLAIAAERGTVVAISTALTPELRAEGLAREIVRRVQAMRKEAGFSIEDRIELYYQAVGAAAEVMAGWGAYIRTETLSLVLAPGAPPTGAYVETHDIDGETLVLGVRRPAAQG